METRRVVLKECGAALQARGGDVVAFAEDMVGALVTADGSNERNGWSAMAALRRPECEPVTV